MKDKYLIITYGLPSVGKSSVSKKIAKVASDEGYSCMIFNPGEERRQNPEYSWLQYSDDFEENQVVLNEISFLVFTRCINEVLQCKQRCIGIFDQTFTRKKARKQVWDIVSANTDIHFVILEICNNSSQKTIERFRNKIKNTEYSDMLPENALLDFSKRYSIYKKKATHYKNDRYFKSNRISNITYNRDSGEIYIGGKLKKTNHIVKIVTAAIQKNTGK